MSEDLTKTIVKLPNGVSLTWPSDLPNVEVFGSVNLLLSFIVRQVKVPISYDLVRTTDGKILSSFKENGSNQA